MSLFDDDSEVHSFGLEGRGCCDLDGVALKGGFVGESSNILKRQGHFARRQEQVRNETESIDSVVRR